MEALFKAKEREEQPPKGKGNYLVVNYLTPKGKKLLAKLLSEL
jgi:hypothetical protein